LSAVKAADLSDFLVADLRIVSITRKLGTRRYETTITARERIFDTLNTTRVPKAVNEQPLPQAVQALLVTAAGLKPERHFELHDLPATVKREFPAAKTLRENLQLVAERLEESSGKRGRGMLLIRNGVLHIGPRPVPLEGEAKKLTLGGGLIEP